MNPGEIEKLFPVRVAATSGSCRPEDVKSLRQLSHEETPDNYATWAEKRQREYRAGRHFAHLALARWHAPAQSQCASIIRDADGVPSFPAGVSGSITHTGRAETFAAAVVGNAKTALGVDSELRASWSPKLSGRVLLPDEQSALDKRAAGLRQFESTTESGLLAFSAKEAFYKCVFPHARIRFDFHDVEFHLIDERNFTVRPRKPHPRLPEQLEGRWALNERLVVCGVSWPLTDSTSANT